MKRFLTILLFVASSFSVIGCDSESDNLTPSLPTQGASRKVAAPLAVGKFTPPTTTSIDEKKAKQYLNASAALLMLGEEWSSKIEQAKSDEKSAILQNYEKAREQVCLRIGLSGLAEYNWITNVASKDSSNSEVFKAVGIRL